MMPSPTTKNKNPSVAYQYPVYEKPAPQFDRQIEHVPGIGEVIVASAQDRFEAPPLFTYRNKLKSATYGPPPKPSATAAPAPVATAPTPPRLTQPVQSGDLYNSPYSSYNPTNYKPDDPDIANLYPPNVLLNPESSSMTSPAQTPVNEAKANTPDSYASLGPPLASYDDDDHNHGQDQLEHDHAPPRDSMSMYKYHNGPPQDPPKSIDDVYYPPDFPNDQMSGHGIGGNGDMMQTDDHGMMPPGDGKYNADNDPPDDHGMAPPPSHDYEHSHAFPPYLYDNHHYDHHVYEEVPHTTMAPEKEDKRVSSTNYSYYYLGRKLWYIPLYFSVYFIIYVTVLILKSIARHKVRLKYKWYEHDTSAKQARSMNLDTVKDEELTNLHHNISVAVNNATEKYNSVIAM